MDSGLILSTMFLVVYYLGNNYKGGIICLYRFHTTLLVVTVKLLY